MQFKKEDLFTIPNLMGYFRLLMIPVFCVLYLNGQQAFAIGVLVISSLTDFLDGKIARRFHMVTDLGKMLDPVADKLTHAALAFCLTVRYPQMWAVIALMVVKEGYMLWMGLKRMKEGREVQPAKMSGKVCTAYLFVMMVILIAFPELPMNVVYGLVILALLMMMQAFVFYIVFFRKKEKEDKDAEDRRKQSAGI